MKALRHSAFLLLATAALAQDTPPVDTSAMLTSLQQLKEKHEASTKAQQDKLIEEFAAAGANNSTAIAFYEDAIRATQFEGQNRENAQFRDWKKREGDKLKNPDLQNAARLSLNYLALTLRRAAGDKIEALIPPLMAYADQVDAGGDGLADQDLMKRPVNDNIFVRWYGIGNMLAGVKDWELTPGKTDGIYSKTILPQFRKTKDPRLLQYWDNKIQREAAQASRTTLAFTADAFDQTRKPALLWSRSQDMLLLGQRNRAIGEMFALIKNNPTHPDSGAWISKLESILQGAPAQSDATE